MCCQDAVPDTILQRPPQPPCFDCQYWSRARIACLDEEIIPWSCGGSRFLCRTSNKHPGCLSTVDRLREPTVVPVWRSLLFGRRLGRSNCGLIEILEYATSLSQHCKPIVCILCDQNIHNRCVKSLYSDRTQRWNWHETLKRTPLLYGCLHPYKYLAMHVWRRFHGLFVYFGFGHIGLGKAFGLYPKLRVIECTIAAILKCAPHFLQLLRRKARRLKVVVDHGGSQPYHVESRTELVPHCAVTPIPCMPVQVGWSPPRLRNQCVPLVAASVHPLVYVSTIGVSPPHR